MNALQPCGVEWPDAGASCPVGLPLKLPELPQLVRQDAIAAAVAAARSARRSNLTQCMNLAPAGTGSQSLVNGLGALAPGRWHHDHFWRVAPEGNGVHCFMMTLRDPAARLASGFRYLSQWRAAAAPSVTSFVADLRNSSAPAHADAMRSYREAAAWPTRRVVRAGGVPVLVTCANPDGRGLSDPLLPALGELCFFMMPHVGYLRGFDSHDALHVLCTETLDADWAALLRRFGYGARPLAHSHLRAAAVERREGELNGADAEFVRRCLFPWDAWLHRELCAAARPSRGVT